MSDVQIAVIDQQNTEVTIAVPGIQGIQGQTGDVAVAQDGTAGTPGIRFENDTNTGIYRPGADQLAISTNGTGRLFVDASGNVGVGTSVPTAALHVSVNDPAIFIQDANGTGDAINATIQFRDSSDTQQAYFGYASGSDSHFSLFNKLSGGDLRFGTANSERFRCDSSGRLLVGTSTALTGATAQYSKNVNIGNSANSAGNAVVAIGRGTAAASLASGNQVGSIYFTDNGAGEFASIDCFVDATPGVNDYPGRLVFSVTADGASSPTEQLRITSDRYVRLASGTGGIQFNGDTAAANALDDYEEGTWTPVVQFGGASVGIAGIFTGTYTKIGDVVTIFYQLSFSSKGASTGAMTITGVPFSAGASLRVASGFGYVHRLAAAQTAGQLVAGLEFSVISPRFIGYSNGNTTQLTDADIGNTTDIRGAITYKAA